MASRKQILLITDNPADAAAQVKPLSEHYTVNLLEQMDHLSRLKPADVDALLLYNVAEGRAALAAFFNAMPASRAPIVHVGQRDEQTIALSREARSFTHIDAPAQAADLHRVIDALLRPRVDLRVASTDYSMRGTTLDNSPFECRLMDISNRGAAFSLPSWMDVRGFLPDKPLGNLRVCDGTRTLLDTRSGVVRSIRTEADARGGQHYRVGVAFLRKREGDDSAPVAVVKDNVAIASLLQDTFKHRTVWASLGDGTRAPMRVSEMPDPKGTLLDAELPGLAVEAGDVLHCSFEANGEKYAFYSGVVRKRENNAAVIRMPNRLSRVRQRRGGRLAVSHVPRLTVSLTSPFGTEVQARQVQNLSLQGVGLEIDAASEILPIGTHLEHVTLGLPTGAIMHLRGTVRALTPFTRDGRERANCGIQFATLTPAEQLALINIILNPTVSNANDGLREASGSSFAEVWGFLRSVGFLYPEKEAKLTPYMPDVEKTFTALLQRPNGLGKSLVFRRGGHVLGHLSGLRAYSKTWLVHHLGATKRQQGDPQVVRMMLLGIAQYWEQTNDMEWLQMTFRPNNKWPQQAFGGYAARTESAHSQLKTLSYLVASAETPITDADPHTQVMPATGADLKVVEAHALATLGTIDFEARDLSKHLLAMAAVDDAYRDIGLQRMREVWVVRDAEGLAGYALLEFSSVGLNLSELLSTFRVSMVRAAPTARAALIDRARRRYGERGRRDAIALAPQEDEAAFQALGFVKTKEYTTWTLHRSLIRTYLEHVDRVTRRDDSSKQEPRNA